jgi:hypothetical protein
VSVLVHYSAQYYLNGLVNVIKLKYLRRIKHIQELVSLCCTHSSTSKFALYGYFKMKILHYKNYSTDMHIINQIVRMHYL